MKIPRLSACCDLELLGTDGRMSRYGAPGVALRITARVNGEVFAQHAELRPELLDHDGYGESIIREMEVQIGRAVVRGNVPDDPKRRIEYDMVFPGGPNDGPHGSVRRTR